MGESNESSLFLRCRLHHLQQKKTLVSDGQFYTGHSATDFVVVLDEAKCQLSSLSPAKETGTDSLIKAEMIKAWDALKVDGYKPQLAQQCEAVQNSMIQGRDNYVFLASTDELFVNGMMQQLSLFTKNYDDLEVRTEPCTGLESLSLDCFKTCTSSTQVLIG